MTPTRFEELLDRHGPDLDRWPDGDALQARALLAVSPSSREALELAMLVEDALATRPLETAGPALRRAVLDIPLNHPRTVAGPGPLERLAAWLATGWHGWATGAATAAASLTVGVVLGYGGLVSLPGLSSDEAAPELQLVELMSTTLDTDLVQ